MHAVTTMNKQTYICLDSNINAFTAEHNNTHMDYFSNIYSHGFTQLIGNSTRICGGGVSLIDHILTNSNQNQFKSGVIVSDLSDHFPTFTIVPNTEKTNKKPKIVGSRNFSKTNMDKFRDKLRTQDWRGVLETTDVNLSYDNFWQSFQANYGQCFPVSNSKFNKNIHKINSYMTQGLLISRRTKLALYTKTLTTPTQENTDRYKAFRNKYNSLIRASRKQYFEQNLYTARKNPKKSWELINEATNKVKKQAKIEKLSTENGIITDQQEMANEFNKFFVGAGKHIADNIRPTHNTAEQYLPPPLEHELHFGTIGQAEVVDIMRSMLPKASQDAMGLSLKILRQVAMEVSIPLTHIFNLSLSQGIFPEALKTSRIVPIHKGGEC